LVGDGATFIQGDISDQMLMRGVVREYAIDSVIHLAGSVVAPESVQSPLHYYQNNTSASRNLLEICVDQGIRNFVFSSTAAVYGSSLVNPIPEDAPTVPISPYGKSKLMTEWMLQDTAAANDFYYIALRYFNVAGADLNRRTGQSTRKATHLIKRACQAALGRIPHLEIFGTDYPTPDGTGIRDYTNVVDLVDAHLTALDALRGGRASGVYNVGYGRGFSVRDVIDAVERETGRTVPVRERPRRAGEPACVVADSTRLRETLGWRPAHAELSEIIRLAYCWESMLGA
jgi:UDP-glucose 4-epimerase